MPARDAVENTLSLRHTLGAVGKRFEVGEGNIPMDLCISI
jgi:hypothetical protein